MGILIKIAKNELRYLFYSPIAWFLTIVFLVECAFFYVGSIYPWATTAYMVYRNNPDWVYRATESSTMDIFFNQDGLIVNVLQNLYLFAPLLTMSIISREVNNGTIKLLYSSPVTLRQIVFGKYLALLFYSILLVAVVGIFIVLGFFDIKSLDYGLLLSAALGFFLLISAYTAIGFFMSSVTVYPIVSAIASFTIFFILGYIGLLWQQYDFVREITYFLSITDHTQRLMAGLITTRDVVYFVVIIYIFIGFTILKLKEGREVSSWFIKTSRYLAVIVSGLLIGYISARPSLVGYCDVTARETNTVHPATRQVLRELGDSPLEVTLFTNLLGKNARFGLPSGRMGYYNFWESYQRFKRNITFKYDYYYNLSNSAEDSSVYKMFPGKSLKQISGLVAQGLQIDSSLFKAPEQMSNLHDLADENYMLVMQLKYRGRSVFLRTYDNVPWPSQQNVNAALKRLLAAKMPKVAFVTGQLERSIYKRGEREYSGYTIAKRNMDALVNVGFDVDTVNLSTDHVAPDVTTLVLADPKMELSPKVLDELEDCIARGVNMLILGEPGKQQILNPLLKRLGVQLMNGQLVENTYNETPDKVSPYISESGLNLAEDLYLLKYRHLWMHNVRKEYDTLTIKMAGVTALSSTGNNGFSIKPLYSSRPGRAWLKAGPLVVDSLAPFFNLQEGDIAQHSFPVGLQLTRPIKGREQRIIICADADFTSQKRGNNNNVAIAMYSWLSNNQFPVYTPVPYAKDNVSTITPSGAMAEKVIFMWILPGLLLALSIVLLTRRRRK